MNALRHFIVAILVSFALSASAFAADSVDINSADAKTLAEGLAGIGLTKAEAIVAYREEHGPFKSADDLAKVKGVGKKTVDKNRDSITVGGGTVAKPKKMAAVEAGSQTSAQ